MKPRGFTLIELIIVMAILAILATLAAPSFTQMQIQSQVTRVVDDMVMGLYIAQSEAMKSQQKVVLCRSADGLSCNDQGDESDWSQGWMMFKERTLTSPIDFNGQDQPLAAFHYDLMSDLSIAHHTATPRILSVQANGRTANSHFLVCYNDGVRIYGQKVTIIGTGRAVIETVNPCQHTSNP